MGWKEFLKPTIGKILIAIVLAVLFYFYQINTMVVACPEAVGFSCNKQIAEAKNTILIVSIISIIPFYLISCLIIFIYKKLRIKI